MMYRKFISVIILLLLAVPLESVEKKAITFEKFIKIGRVSDPRLSPDGKNIAFVITYYDKEKNTGNSDIWLIPFKGGKARKLTNSEKADYRPRWSPDGKKIAFISTRSGKPQIWVIPVEGGEAEKVTEVSTGAGGVEWSPDGKYFLFTSSVYPDCPDDDCNKKKDEEKEKSKVKAKIITELLYRHWDQWRDSKRSHLFIIPSEGGDVRDLTPGNYDVPPISLGSRHDYTFSPDGGEVAFVM
ncbi:MAG: TolB family protein, partial [Fidelibacterota bacterium]